MTSSQGPLLWWIRQPEGCSTQKPWVETDACKYHQINDRPGGHRKGEPDGYRYCEPERRKHGSDKGRIQAGDRVTIEMLLYAALLKSANDAAVALQRL